MTEFCGIFLKPGVDPALGPRRVAAMLDAFGRDGHEVEEHAPVPELSLGFATPPGYGVMNRQAVRLVDRQNMVAFGSVTLWNRDRYADDLPADCDLHRVHAYLRHGHNPARINADMAIGTYDRASGRLTLLRDPLGWRVIVYAERPEGLIFASNPRFLFGAGMGALEHDPLSIAAYMVTRHPGIGRSYMKRVSELGIGHRLIATGGAVRETEPYFHFAETPNHRLKSHGECVEYLREHLVRAVRARTEGTDRPAIMLSGGLDSSTLAGIVAAQDPGREVLAVSHRPTYTIPDDPDDDNPHIDAVAAHWPNMKLVDVSVPDLAIRSGADDWFHSHGIPSPEPYPASGNAVRAAAAANGAPVILDGEFGDEALSTHSFMIPSELLLEGKFRMLWEEMDRFRTVWGWPRRRVVTQRIIANLVPSWVRRAWQFVNRVHWADDLPVRREWLENPALLRLLRNDGFRAFKRKPATIREMIEKNSGALRSQYFRRNHMRFGDTLLHLRSPLSDIELVSAVYWTPVEHFISPDYARNLIREVGRPFLPEKVRTRHGKAPFIMDLATKLAQSYPELHGEFQRLSADPDVAEIFDMDRLNAFWKRTMALQTQEAAAYPNYAAAIFNASGPILVGRYIELLKQKRSGTT